MMKEDIEKYEKQINSWKELKKRYKEEMEMKNDVEMNTFLFENCNKEIEILEKLINQ